MGYTIVIPDTLGVAINCLLSLNVFSVVVGPLITISANKVNTTAGTTITPITITNKFTLTVKNNFVKALSTFVLLQKRSMESAMTDSF
jgi:capsular polysaccharide biosynthesis protein